MDGSKHYEFKLDDAGEYQLFGWDVPHERQIVPCIVSEDTIKECGFDHHRFLTLPYAEVEGRVDYVKPGDLASRHLKVERVTEKDIEIDYIGSLEYGSVDELSKYVFPRADGKYLTSILALLASLAGSSMSASYMQAESPGVGYSLALQQVKTHKGRADVVTAKEVGNLSRLLAEIDIGGGPGSKNLPWSRYFSLNKDVQTRSIQKEVDWNTTFKLNELANFMQNPLDSTFSDVTSLVSPRMMPAKASDDMILDLQKTMLYLRYMVKLDYGLDFDKVYNKISDKLFEPDPNIAVLTSMRFEPATDAVLKLMLLEEKRIETILERPNDLKIDENDYMRGFNVIAAASADFVSEATENYIKDRNLVQELMGADSSRGVRSKIAEAMYVQILRRNPHGVGLDELAGFVKRNFDRKTRKDAISSYLDQMEKEDKITRRKDGKYIIR